MPAKANPIGHKFGRLSVTSFSHMGHTQSCGCIRKETAAALKLSHGQAPKNHKTKTYQRWRGIKQRCTNPKHISYKNYGGRGITVCERWLSYENFFADMGVAPDGMYIDRINNDGNYEPSNCRWTDPVTSARNRRHKKKRTQNEQPAN